MKHFYVYCLTNTITGEFYYGFRSIPTSIDPIDDLLISYFSSSKIVKQQIAMYGSCAFRSDIIHIYDVADDAFWHEQRLIKDAFLDPKCLNKHFVDPLSQKKVFHTVGTSCSLATKSKISKSNTGRRHTTSEETKMKISNALKGRSSPLKGRRQSLDHIEKSRQARLGKTQKSKGRSKIVSDAWRSAMESTNWSKKRGSPGNRLGTIHRDETKQKISIAKQGQSPPNKGVPAQKFECRFCNKMIGGSSNLLSHERKCSAIKAV